MIDSFWTSGSSVRCPKRFAWCSTKENERVDFEGLKYQNIKSGNDCLAVTIDRKEDSILLSDDCKNKRRVICEVNRHKCLGINFYFNVQIKERAAKQVQRFTVLGS